jgi:hypothetical protein
MEKNVVYEYGHKNDSFISRNTDTFFMRTTDIASGMHTITKANNLK